MDMHEALEYASQRTEILRSRRNPLYTFGSTRLPYVCISAAEQGKEEVVVRRGEVTAERPKIIVPGRNCRFDGFDFEALGIDAAAAAEQFFLARRIEMPAAHYTNKSGLTITESGHLSAAAERAINRLDQQNDIRTAVMTTPDSVWNLAILLYVGSQIVRSAPANIAEHVERLQLRGG